MIKVIPAPTKDRIRRLLIEWRNVEKAVGIMNQIYDEENSETRLPIDEAVHWPKDVVPMSLDDWRCEISAMIERIEATIRPDYSWLVGLIVRCLYFDAGWFQGKVIDDPDNGLMLDPETLTPPCPDAICPLATAHEFQIVWPPLPSLDHIYNYCKPLVSCDGEEYLKALDNIAIHFNGQVLQTGGHVYVAVIPYGQNYAVGIDSESMCLYYLDRPMAEPGEIFYDGKELFEDARTFV